jgi:hypothetical protein
VRAAARPLTGAGRGPRHPGGEGTRIAPTTLDEWSQVNDKPDVDVRSAVRASELRQRAMDRQAGPPAVAVFLMLYLQQAHRIAAV